MILFYLSFFIVLVSGDDCDKNGIIIYEDFACTPTYGLDKKCPIKYSCTGLEPTNQHCHFRGRTYGNGEKVSSSLTTPSCNEGCFCRTGTNSSSFTCAILDCPEWLGVPTPKNCYRKYNFDNCCSVGYNCPPFDNIEKCVVEGKEYREGEKFSPSNTCLSCICMKGFKGKFEEPFCKRMVCGEQLRHSSQIQDSCAAFYSKQLNPTVLCCPDNWICDDGNEEIKGESKSDDTCKFGSRTVKVGQYIEKENVEDSFGRSFKKVKCECVIPPLMKCIDVE